MYVLIYSIHFIDFLYNYFIEIILTHKIAQNIVTITSK